MGGGGGGYAGSLEVQSHHMYQGRRKVFYCGTVSHLKYIILVELGGSSENFSNLEHKSVPFVDSQGRASMPGTNSGTVNTVVTVACPTPLCSVPG